MRTFPSNQTAMLLGYTVKPSFTLENEKEISRAPAVDFAVPKVAASAK